MASVDVRGSGSRRSRTSELLVRALRDRELRRAAARLAADAVVLARTMEEARARAGRAQRKGRRKAVLFVLAGAAALGLAVGAKKSLRRG